MTTDVLSSSLNTHSHTHSLSTSSKYFPSCCECQSNLASASSISLWGQQETTENFSEPLAWIWKPHLSDVVDVVHSWKSAQGKH